jgi:hypothetical protein
MMCVGFDKLSTVGCQKDFVVQGELIIIKRRTLITVKNPDWGQLYSQQARVFETEKTPAKVFGLGESHRSRMRPQVARLSVGRRTKRPVEEAP